MLIILWDIKWLNITKITIENNKQGKNISIGINNNVIRRWWWREGIRNNNSIKNDRVINV